jgi:hypothetical protein
MDFRGANKGGNTGLVIATAGAKGKKLPFTGRTTQGRLRVPSLPLATIPTELGGLPFPHDNEKRFDALLSPESSLDRTRRQQAYPAPQ